MAWNITTKTRFSLNLNRKKIVSEMGPTEIIWLPQWHKIMREWGDLPMIFTSDEVTSKKSLANHLTSDKKIVIHGKEYIILFLTCYFMSWTHHSATNKHRSLFSPLSLRTVFSDSTLWRHHSWPVTSCEHEALALWRHIRWLFLHAQIGAKAIFTSE